MSFGPDLNESNSATAYGGRKVLCMEKIEAPKTHLRILKRVAIAAVIFPSVVALTKDRASTTAKVNAVKTYKSGHIFARFD